MFVSVNTNMTKENLQKLINQGLSTREIAEQFNKSITTVRYWLNKFSLKTQWRGSLNVTDEQLLRIAKTCESFNDLMRKLNKINSGGAFYHYRKRCKLLNISFTNNCKSTGGKITARKQNQICVKQKKRLRRSTLKKHMDIHKVPYRCNVCGLTHWRNIPLTLHIHHVDHDRTNNSISNLVYICPNCHSIEHNKQ